MNRIFSLIKYHLGSLLKIIMDLDTHHFEAKNHKQIVIIKLYCLF